MTDSSFLPLLALRGQAVFPGVTVNIPVVRPRSVALADDLSPGASIVLGLQRRPSTDRPTRADLYDVAVRAEVTHIASRPLGGRVLTVSLVERCRLLELDAGGPYLRARVERAPDHGDAELIEEEAEVVRYQAALRLSASEQSLLAPAARPGVLADVLASILPLTAEEAMVLLISTDVVERLAIVRDVLELRLPLPDDTGDENAGAYSPDKGPDSARDDLAELRQQLGDKDLPDGVRQEAEREMKRLSRMTPSQPEYANTRTWLECVLSLPWLESAGSDFDLDGVREALDRDHYGLDDVKKRVLEHMAVLKLTGTTGATVLCLAGPPGVGKTSLGESIATATGRPFARVSLGGVRDEAELRGHRRTYIGALPGRIIGALRKAGKNNAVILLDEIDKLGAWWRGTPESALLEVLDPEQNDSFTDHYLDLPFDLSQVLFICTVNDLSQLSAPLRDRLEVITLDGYAPSEKVAIAKAHLIDDLQARHGLEPGSVLIDDETLHRIVAEYTREAGVRQLKRELARIYRASALHVARGDASETLAISAQNLGDYLGRPRFRESVAERLTQSGVSTGLAWTPTGGDILFIETSRMPGKGRLEVTGQLGDVMKESARAALTYVRSHAAELGVDPAFLAESDVHIHVPAGGVPKDGPSAGVTIFTALTSLLTGRNVRSDTAMTGECTLRGRVLPVGGIKSKLLAAHRAGLTRVILPRHNERDLDDLPERVASALEIILVDDMSQVLEAALERAPETKEVSPIAAGI